MNSAGLNGRPIIGFSQENPSPLQIAKKNVVQAVDSVLPRGSLPRFAVIQITQWTAFTTLAYLAYHILKIAGHTLAMMSNSKEHERMHKEKVDFIIEPAISFNILLITGVVITLLCLCCHDAHKAWKKGEDKAIDLEKNAQAKDN